MKKTKAIQRPKTALIIADKIGDFGAVVLHFFLHDLPRVLVFGVLFPVLRTVELLARLVVKYGRWALVAVLCVVAVPFAAVAAVGVVCVLVIAVPVFLIVK